MHHHYFQVQVALRITEGSSIYVFLSWWVWQCNLTYYRRFTFNHSFLERVGGGVIVELDWICGTQGSVFTWNSFIWVFNYLNSERWAGSFATLLQEGPVMNKATASLFAFCLQNDIVGKWGCSLQRNWQHSVWQIKTDQMWIGFHA